LRELEKGQPELCSLDRLQGTEFPGLTDLFEAIPSGPLGDAQEGVGLSINVGFNEGRGSYQVGETTFFGLIYTLNRRTLPDQILAGRGTFRPNDQELAGFFEICPLVAVKPGLGKSKDYPRCLGEVALKAPRVALTDVVIEEIEVEGEKREWYEEDGERKSRKLGHYSDPVGSQEWSTFQLKTLGEGTSGSLEDTVDESVPWPFITNFETDSDRWTIISRVRSRQYLDLRTLTAHFEGDSHARSWPLREANSAREFQEALENRFSQALGEKVSEMAKKVDNWVQAGVEAGFSQGTMATAGLTWLEQPLRLLEVRRKIILGSASSEENASQTPTRLPATFSPQVSLR
jgi:hypothetical protein